VTIGPSPNRIRSDAMSLISRNARTVAVSFLLLLLLPPSPDDDDGSKL
jgi:hypothetical protein